MNKSLLILVVLVLLFSACSANELPKAAPVEPTVTRRSTSTPQPSPTPEPTATPEPSPTPEPTATEEPTLPPVPDPTDEPRVELDEGRYYEETDKFSYIPIEGWQHMEYPGLTTKILMSSEQSSTGVNLVFISELYEGDTEEYARLGIVGAKQVLENFVEGEYSFFKTDSGLTVVKIPARYKTSGVEIDGIFYIIGDDNDYTRPKLNITLSKFYDSPATIETKVDALIRTIQFED